MINPVALISSLGCVATLLIALVAVGAFGCLVVVVVLCLTDSLIFLLTTISLTIGLPVVPLLRILETNNNLARIARSKASSARTPCAKV